MNLILTTTFFLTLIFSVFGLSCWQCGHGTLSYRCGIDENTGEPEMGNSKNPNNLVHTYYIVHTGNKV